MSAWQALGRRMSFITLAPRTRVRRSADARPRVMFFVETTGLSRLMADAIPKMASVGIDAQFLSLHPRGPLHLALEEHGVPTHSLACRGSHAYPRAAARLGNLLRAEQIDILQSCEPIQAAIGGFGRLAARETIHVFQRQHMWIAYPKQRLLSEVGTRLAHYTLANSDATAQWARDTEGVRAEKLRVAHYGVPEHRPVSPDEVIALRSRLRLPKDAQVVLMVGHLRPEKGQRVLLEAMRAIRAKAPRPTHLIIIGQGPDCDALKASCAQDEASHLMGYQEDIAPWFALADVVVVPSLYDSFPQAAVEVFATKRPLVASAVGGLREIVDSSSGILVPPGQPEPLAHAVLEVLSSAERAAQLATAGYERFRRCFTVDIMVQRWAGLYSDLLRAEGG